MVAARLEIMPSGSIYVSAPDAEDFASADHSVLHRNLAKQLTEQ